MSNFYGATTLSPTSEQVKERDAKVAKAIAYLGNKYLLAKPVGRLTHGG